MRKKNNKNTSGWASAMHFVVSTARPSLKASFLMSYRLTSTLSGSPSFGENIALCAKKTGMSYSKGCFRFQI